MRVCDDRVALFRPSRPRDDRQAVTAVGAEVVMPSHCEKPPMENTHIETRVRGVAKQGSVALRAHWPRFGERAYAPPVTPQNMYHYLV